SRHAAAKRIRQNRRTGADVATPESNPMINAILFDKDGTLFDFYHTWGELTEQAALMVAGGDAEKARFLLENSGKDPATGRYAPSSPIASGSNREIVEV